MEYFLSPQRLQVRFHSGVLGWRGSGPEVVTRGSLGVGERVSCWLLFLPPPSLPSTVMRKGGGVFFVFVFLHYQAEGDFSLLSYSLD